MKDGSRRKNTGTDRWIAEIVFSALKRVLGDTLRARKFLTQKLEASLKVMLYNMFLSIRP